MEKATYMEKSNSSRIFKLLIERLEEAILNGQVIRVEKDDPRGTKYIIIGTALDQQTPVGVVGRFSSAGRYLIITVYEVTEPQS